MRRISPLTTYNTTQSKNDGDFRKFLHFPFIPYTTRKPKTAKNGRVLFLLSWGNTALFQNAEHKRKKTGNLFLISCLGVPFYAAVIQFWGMAVNQSGIGTGQR